MKRILVMCFLFVIVIKTSTGQVNNVFLNLKWGISRTKVEQLRPSAEEMKGIYNDCLEESATYLDKYVTIKYDFDKDRLFSISFSVMLMIEEDLTGAVDNIFTGKIIEYNNLRYKSYSSKSIKRVDRGLYVEKIVYPTNWRYGNTETSLGIKLGKGVGPFGEKEVKLSLSSEKIVLEVFQ